MRKTLRKKNTSAKRLNKTFLSSNPEKPWDAKIIKIIKATLSRFDRMC